MCGDRSTQTFKKLWVKIKDLEVNGFCSDYWKSYSELIPSETHCESKAETFTIEGYNARIRHIIWLDSEGSQNVIQKRYT